MSEGYILRYGQPSPEDYVRLRREAGLSPKSIDAARAGLAHSTAGVVVDCDGQIVGMGRLIGDGHLFMQLVDMAVLPAHQGRGLGKMIMRALMSWLKDNAPGAYVSLIADGEAHRLYAQFGFNPTAPKSIGMALIVPERPC